MTFLVYRTDFQHNNKELIGVATSKTKAIDLIVQDVNISDEELSEDDIFNINNINQTQNHDGDYEYLIENVETNVLFQ